MRSGPWILVFLAIAVLAGVVRLWSDRARETPEALLHGATERLEQLDPNFDLGLRELSSALVDLRPDLDSSDPEVRANALSVGADLLRERARTHWRLSNWGLAVRDARMAIDEFEASSPDLLELAAECALKDKDEATALELAERLMLDAPDRAQGLAFRGEAKLSMVRRAVEAITQKMRDDLPEAAVEEGIPQVQRAIALGPDSSRFEAALESVALTFNRPSSRIDATEQVRRAARWMQAARRDFVDSLGIEPTRLATEGIQEILVHAGQQKDAALFGRLLLDLPQVTLASPTLLRTVEAWITLEQPDRAHALLDTVEKLQPQILDFRLIDTDYFERWAVALYRLEEWPRLRELGGMFYQRHWSLKGQDERSRFLALGQLFQTLAGVAADQTWVRELATRYLDYDGPEPFEGAKLATWLALAKIARLEQDPVLEAFAIGSATDYAGISAPEELRAALGRAWVERAGSFRKLKQPVDEEDALAKSMSVWPLLHAEVEQSWIAAGKRSIAARRRNYEEKRAEYIDLQIYLPEAVLGSYELLQLSEDFLTAGDTFGAQSYVELCLERYPELPAALELRALTAYKAQDFELAADAYLRLIETGGGNFADAELLADLPVEILSGSLGIRWFRAVPPTHALLAMLDRLPTERRRELLLSSLLSQNSIEPLRGGPLMRAAFLCADLRRWDECNGLVGELTEEDPEFAELAGIALLATLNANSKARLIQRMEAVVSRIERASELRTPALLRAVDQLHAIGRRDLAFRVIDRIIEVTTEDRGEVLIRDAIHALLADDVAGARERLLEAGLFVDQVLVDMGRLAIASDKRQWTDVATAARDLESYDAFRTPYERALLLGLRGGPRQLERALEYLALEPARSGTPNPLVPLARMAILASSGAPLEAWETYPAGLIDGQPFVAALGGSPDPRQVLAALLAMRVPAWPIWTLSRLQNFPTPYRLSPWGVTQVAATLAALGEVPRGEFLLGAATGPGAPGFPPAWYLREQLVLERVGGDRTHKDYLDVRGFRVHAAGADGIDPFERDLIAVYTAEWKGDYADAVARLRRLLEIRPNDPELEHRLATNLFEQGLYADAVRAFTPVIEREDEVAFRSIPMTLEALRLATDEVHELHPRARWTFLESLETRFPDDPAIVRERARLQIEGESSSDDFGIARAWELVDAFRERTRQRSIDELRPGEAERWLELFLRFDPIRARRFAQAELHANPASPDARWMWAKVLSESSELHAACDELASSTAAVSHPPSLRLYARLLAELGVSPTRVAGLLDATRVAEGLTQPDAELIYIRALSLLDTPGRDEAVLHLNTLWKSRAQLGEAIDPKDVGLYLSQAYLRRGQDADCVVAGGILDELLLNEPEPVRRDFLRAMAHLARHHAPRDLRDELEPPPTEAQVAARFAEVAR